MRLTASEKGMRFVDSHTHSTFSVDSTADPEQLCESALRHGLLGICITDHLDHCPTDDGFGFYRPEAYFSEIERLRERYAGRLKVLYGLEFGDPQKYQKQFETFCKRPYDTIIGSVHFWHEDMQVDVLAKQVPFEIAMEHYFEAVLDSVAFGGFDVLGHLGFPKKYYGREITYYDTMVVADILSLAIKNGIALECNTSSMTQGLEEPSANKAMIEQYIALGGRLATLGSDAHRPEDVASNFETVYDWYESRLQYGYFENRKFQPI